MPALAWEPLVAVVVCVVLLVWRGKAGAGSVGGYVAVVAVTLLSAPLLAMAVGVSVVSYYPNKVIWGAVFLGLPVVAAVWVWGIETADSRRHRFLLIAVGAGAGLCCVVGIASPLTAPFGAWSTVDGGSFVRIMSAPGADRTQVFWSGRRGALDPTVQILLAMYRKGPLSPFEKLPTGSVAEQCARLRATTEPGVLTTATADEARARLACVPGAAVITTPTR